MSPLNGFFSTWRHARATFGGGAPGDGAQFDQSSQLRSLQDSVKSARPDSAWTGSAADSYAEANSRHERTLGGIADLDKRLGAEVNRSAAVVAAGRRDLDAVKKWVTDAAATVPNTAAGQRMLYPVIAKGSGEITDVINRSHGDLSAIAERIRGLGSEYEGLGGKKDRGGAEPMSGGGGEDDGKGTPKTTLDLNDIVYKDPKELGDVGMMELVPHSGVWVPDPRAPGYRPKPPEAPLDLNDIQYLGPDEHGQPWQMELVPGSGAWVPDPSYPGYQPHPPEAPVDLTKIEIVDPKALIPQGQVELWPHSGVLIPDPYMDQPF